MKQTRYRLRDELNRFKSPEQETEDDADETEEEIEWIDPDSEEAARQLIEARYTLYELMAGIAVLAFFAGAVATVFVSNRLTLWLGLLLGASMALLISVQLYHSIDRALELPADEARRYGGRMTLLRLLLMAAALAIAALLPTVFHPIAVLFGLLCLKLAALAQPLTHRCRLWLLEKKNKS